MTPSTRIAILSLKLSASSISCVVNNTTLFFFILLINSHIYLLLTGSIPVVGSSKNITYGLFKLAIVIDNLLFIPPEYVFTN